MERGIQKSAWKKHGTPRLRRLFACAVCRQPEVWEQLNDESRNSVVYGERRADARCSREELAVVHDTALKRLSSYPLNQPIYAGRAPNWEAWLCSHKTTSRIVPGLMQEPWAPNLVSVFWHIFTQPTQELLSWQPPRLVLDLARSLYEGGDDNYALHDALLDYGQPRIAEHFKEWKKCPNPYCWGDGMTDIAGGYPVKCDCHETPGRVRGHQQHPKGCYVVDALLGRRKGQNLASRVAQSAS